MPMYSMTVSATSNTVAGTEDTFLDLVAAAGSRLLVKRVQVSIETAAQDTRSIVKLLRKSAQGATGTAGVAAKLDSGSRASSVTLTTAVKNGTAAMAVGTIVDTLPVMNLNGRAIWEWIPRNAQEEVYIAGAAIFGVNIACSAVSIVHRVTCWWED